MKVTELSSPFSRLREVYYGWWLVALSSFLMLVIGVSMFYGMAAWFPVLEKTFSWSRVQLTLAFSLTRIEGSVTGPFGGYLVDKLGPRRMILIGTLITGVGLLVFSQIQNLWQFYVAFVIMSMGAGLGSWLPMMTVLNSWFVRKKATAMALAMAGSSAGAVPLVAALAWGIDPNKFGLDRWRDVALGLGVVIILIAFPISRLVRNRPEEYGLRPDGDRDTEDSVAATASEGGARLPDQPGFTWQEAVRTRNFWLISIGHACSSTVVATLTAHLGSMLFVDRGMPLGTVGLVVATYIGVAAVFNLVGGYVGERVPMRMALSAFSMTQSIAVVILLLAGTSPLIWAFAVLLGIGFGGRTPLTTAIRGVYFGRKAFASITGMSMLPINVLLFGMPVFAGYMFDVRGSYTIPFIILAALSFAGSLLFLLLGEPSEMPSPRQAATKSAA